MHHFADRQGALLQSEFFLLAVYLARSSAFNNVITKLNTKPFYLESTETYVYQCALSKGLARPADYIERLGALTRFNVEDTDFEDEVRTLKLCNIVVPDDALATSCWRTDVQVDEIAAAKVGRLEVITIDKEFLARFKRVYRHISFIGPNLDETSEKQTKTTL